MSQKNPATPHVAPVPLIEHCPGCGYDLEGVRCKVLCRNPGCELFGRIVENCAGD